MVEGFEIWLDAHHRHHSGGLVDGLAGQRAGSAERLDLFIAGAVAQVVQRHFGVDPGQPKWAQLVLRADLTHHLDVVRDATGRAGAAGRADDHRDVALAGGDQQQLEVEKLPFARIHRLVRAQEVGPTVAAAGVGPNEVERALDALVESLGVDWLVAERAGGG